MEDFTSSIKKSLSNWGFRNTDRLLLAVSGGMDSIVLADSIYRCGFDFGIVHANFQLRDKESDRDENFVRELAAGFKKSFFVKKFDTATFAESEKISIQEAARKLRYEWFNTLINEPANSFRFLLTAHHLDDNIETMLMFFFRGTGIIGLTGIPGKNGKILRPLLEISRLRLHNYAVERQLIWVEDSSNVKNDYTRNFFRNQLIPSVSGIFPDLRLNMENNLKRFREVALLYEQSIALFRKKLLLPMGSEFHIPILLLTKSEPLATILLEILRDFHFIPAQIPDIIQLTKSENGKFVSSNTHRIIKNRRWLIIAPKEEKSISHVVIEDAEKKIIYPNGVLSLKFTDRSVLDSKTPISKTENLNGDHIQFPMLLRKWKTGDYFYPLGMKKKKKIARFLIDLKLSKTEKEKTWVLVMNEQIIWVVGYRIDNRFAYTTSNKKILQIKNEDV